MASTSLLLVVVCAIQFVIILYFINNSNSYNSSSNDSVITNISSKIVALSPKEIDSSGSYNTSKNRTATVTAVANELTNTVDGVAVTFFLHSPTWFQRRYTMMVYNVLNNLPDDWRIQIFHSGKGQSINAIDINIGLKRLIDSERITMTVIPPEVFNTKRKQIHLMTDAWIWQNMLADKVLLFGGNQVICSNSPYTLRNFTQYDYIGAPWQYGRGESKGMGGDGSISIRNRKLMIQVIEYELSKHTSIEDRANAYKSWGQEDIFFMSRIIEMQQKGLISANIATRDDTKRFAAIGGYANNETFAASGILPIISDSERDKFLVRCPELKLLYPSLHNPNCFGATPDASKCKPSICALRDSHKGGC